MSSSQFPDPSRRSYQHAGSASAPGSPPARTVALDEPGRSEPLTAIDPPIRLLIADGQKLAVDTLIELLGEENHVDVVGVATNGAEAVDLAAALSPDVVLIAPALPVLDGYEATRRIQAQSRAPRVLVLTAAEGDVSVGKARDAGAAGFVRKDAGAAELVGIIVSMASLALG